MGYKSTDFLLRLFVKEYQQLDRSSVRKSYGVLEGWVSVGLNVVLFIIKLIFGLAINSVSLIADAVHTLADVVTSGIVIISFWVAGKPKDAEHPYGHGRAEQIATLIIAVLLAIVGFEFLQQSAKRFVRPQPVDYNMIVMVVLLLSTVLKEWMYRFAKDLGERIDSPALLGDAWHHRTDAFASLGIGVGLLGVFLGYPQVDAVLGVVVSGLIIFTAYGIGRECINQLLGVPPSNEIIQSFTAAALAIEGVLGVHDIAMHEYGEEKYITAHIEVAPHLTIVAAHRICHQAEETVGRVLGAHISLHVDPREH